MKVIGLTGGIAMGKSTIARYIGSLGIPVTDADAIAHQLLAVGGAAVAAVAAEFPDTFQGGAIDRKKLGGEVFDNVEKLKKLEAIIHPLVRAEEEAFVKQMATQGHRLVVLDIPLLFETGAEKRCDKVMVVSAPACIQRRRALARPGMTVEKFEAIMKLQMPDAEKRRRADSVIPTGYGKCISFFAVKHALRKLGW